MNSTQLLNYFCEREEALGEQANNFSMFLEGYSAGIEDNDMKKYVIKKSLDYWHKILDSQGINPVVFVDYIEYINKD